jgi:hypothetical protein
MQGAGANPPSTVDTGSAGLVATPSGGSDWIGVPVAAGLGFGLLTVALWRRRIAR